MKKNIGTVDRVVRLVAAVAIGIALYMKVVAGTPAIVLAVIAVVLFGTALIGWCGLYAVLGINTCKCSEPCGCGCDTEQK